MSQSEITLPPGCLLSKANSSDRLEFKKLERQYIIKSFPPLLVSFLLILVILVLPSGNFNLVSILFIVGFLGYVLRLMIIYFRNKTFFDLSNTWYIKCQGRLVAWAALNQNRKGSRILCLFVVENWRRKGLGSALVNCLIQEAPPPLSLFCEQGLVSFYSRLGFVPSRPDSFFPPLPNVFNPVGAFGQYMVYKDFNHKLRPNKP